MASVYSSSDDESDLTLIPDSVTDYQFVDEEDSPISFSDLPYESPNSESPQVYLRATTEDKLQKVYQQVTAWKLEISRKLGPEVFVLSNAKWVQLLKPRKVYESIIRGIWITVQALHFLRWNPNSVEKSLWDNLRRVFEKFEVRPSEDDFIPHTHFMKHFTEKDPVLAESQLLKNFLDRKGTIRTGEGKSGVLEVKHSFIAEDDEVEETGDTQGDESEEEDADLFDSVCSICDNGGDLLCCEGECMRSFHATEEAGEDSTCESLGLTSAQVEAIQNFLCENCKVKRHQCFVCGKLGNSDKTKGAEVFQCSNATCGYFYHPNCVARLLCPDDEAAASECEKTVLEGRFACPYHKCAICKKLEDKADPDLQFAICRRCPKSYHRKCLPRKISFTADPGNGIMIRAWEDLLPNRVLIYCLKHKIDEELLTPRRDHIVFPNTVTAQGKQKARSSEVPSHKLKPPLIKRRESDNRDTSPADRRPLKKRTMLSVEVPSGKGRGVGHPDQLGKGKAREAGESAFLKKVKKPRESDLSREQPSGTASLKKVKNLQRNNLSREEGSGIALVARSRSPSPREVAIGDLPSYSGNIPYSSHPVIDAAVENKMKEFLEKESVTVKDVIKRLTIPKTHQHSGRHIEKITRGKIEGSVEAIRTAYQRIVDGGSVDDAKAVCEPEIVKQVVKWHKRLGVYLSPFIHGMRYTSFGRHFTKEDKLQEICSKLQWYVKANDTIVDFCCGSNDFSRIMKEKMDGLGKLCHFKNYDIVPPKDDFCYEKRDWMTVLPKELPNGGSLIMGLNPPFGTKASLANKFVDKALTFNPKLVILIVPKETERLDEKRTPYDLVWVDNVMLSGMSFYLPGSVDVNDKKMDQWNEDPPLLYLWSRPDWTARHKAIAEEHAHFSNLTEDMPVSPPHSPLPSQKEQREAEDIISQVVGDISVVNNEVMEMGLEDKMSRKGKGKVDPVSCELGNQTKSRSTVLKQKEEKDVGAFTSTIEEVNKANDKNQGREKRGSLERTDSRREARGITKQNEGRIGRTDQNSGASSPLKEARVNKPHCEDAVPGSRGEYTNSRHHNEGGATRDYQEASVLGPGNNFRDSEVQRTEKIPDMRELHSYNNTRRSPDMRTSVPSHNRRKSPPSVVDSRSDKMRQSPSGNVSDMDISPTNGRHHVSEIRGDNTAAWENNNNPSRYDSTSNRGNGTLQRENNSSRYNGTSNRGNSTLQKENNSSRYDSTSNRGNSTLQGEDNTSGDVLGEFQYINNAPLMEQLMDTRQLDAQLDFSDLDPILSNGNDDLNDFARLYPTSSSYHWPDASGMGSGSVLESNRAPVPDYVDPRGFDDFDGLGRFYGSYDDNRRNNFGAGAIGQPASTFHNNMSLPSYGLSGLGGSTSTSALDRYAPRLDETNYLPPGGSGFSGGSHHFHQGPSGPPPYSYGINGLDRRDIPAPHQHPYPPGFVPRQQHSYRPPPGSGGWID